MFALCQIAVCIQIYKVSRSNWLWPEYTKLFKVRTLYFASSSSICNLVHSGKSFKSHLCQCIACFCLGAKTEHEADYLKTFEMSADFLFSCFTFQYEQMCFQSIKGTCYKSIILLTRVPLCTIYAHLCHKWLSSWNFGNHCML